MINKVINIDLNKLLRWADQFSSVAFLHGNNVQNYPEETFKTFLAVSNQKTAVTSLGELETALGTDWLFGHIGYDLKNQIEKLSSNNKETIDFGDLSFFLPDLLLELRIDGQQVVELTILKGNPEILTEIEGFTAAHPKPEIKIGALKCNITQEEYYQIFDQVIHHIVEGDIYEMNLCMEFFADNTRVDPAQFYIDLTKISPAPFACFYKSSNKYLISGSPERFFKKNGRRIVSQPIKGTNASDEDEEVNKAQQLKLLSSEKERSENMMIVDLVRNDLAKNSIPGSTGVTELFGVYKLGKVNQMISTIASELEEDKTITDVIKGAFPMGSMTGAPKIEAMKIIEKLEKSKRGLYSGTVGYITPNCDCDFNVIIRSLLYDPQEEKISFQVGGAITYDAEKESEYEECMLKSKTIKQVLNSYAV